MEAETGDLGGIQAEAHLKMNLTWHIKGNQKSFY